MVLLFTCPRRMSACTVLITRRHSARARALQLSTDKRDKDACVDIECCAAADDDDDDDREGENEPRRRKKDSGKIEQVFFLFV